MINVGKVIAKFIADRPIDKHIGLDVESYFKDMIGKRSQDHAGVRGVAISNFGILLEPTFSLNVEKVLLDLSREIAIVLVWAYGVEHSRRFVWDHANEVAFEFPEHTIQSLEASP
jgi:hypothetical protein